MKNRKLEKDSDNKVPKPITLKKVIEPIDPF